MQSRSKWDMPPGLSSYRSFANSLQPATILASDCRCAGLWGGRPRPRPTPTSACQSMPYNSASRTRASGAAPGSRPTPPGLSFRYVTALLLAASFCTTAPARADQPLPRELQGVGVDEHLGASIDRSLTFTAENGYPVALGDYFKSGRPVILNLVYYSCPMLCNLLLNGQTAALRGVPGTPGEDFEVVTISIDPGETFELARRKKATYLASYGRETSGWHFLIDKDGAVKKLAAEVGFRYRYDEQQTQYAHTAVITVLTPEGRISRYLYGITFSPRDIRLALAEAAEGKLGLSERILLFCYHYDPQARGYVLFATDIMRAGGVLTVAVLALILGLLWRRERRRPRVTEEVPAS